MYESPPPADDTSPGGAPPLWSWLLACVVTGLIGSQVQRLREDHLQPRETFLLFIVVFGSLFGFLTLLGRTVWKDRKVQSNAYILPFFIGSGLAAFYGDDLRLFDIRSPRALLIFSLVVALFITLFDDLYFRRYARDRWRWSPAVLLAMLVVLPLSLQVRRLDLPDVGRQVLGVLLVSLVYAMISGQAVTMLPLRTDAGR